MNITHILNGDALKSQFPSSIKGELIVARECLVDGNVQGDTLEVLFANRTKYLESFQDVGEGSYAEKSIPEFEKMLNLTDQDNVFVWFEDDLFCQVNFWFVIHLLVNNTNIQEVHLVRPNKGNEYSFGFMKQLELQSAFEQPILIAIDDLKNIAKLWPLYQQEHYSQMLKMTHLHLNKYEFFITPAIKAQIDRAPDEQGFGRPQRALIAIMKELNTKDFDAVFRLFCQREAIYSFGDLQVKRMFDDLV